MKISALIIAMVLLFNDSQAELVEVQTEPPAAEGADKTPKLDKDCSVVEVNKMVDSVSNTRLKIYSLCIGELKTQLDIFCKNKGGSWSVSQVTRKAWMSHIDVKLESYESYSIDGYCRSSSANDSEKPNRPRSFTKVGYISADGRRCEVKDPK